jgi:hypothetical protein
VIQETTCSDCRYSSGSKRHGSVPVARHQSRVVHRSTCVARSTPKRDVTKPRLRTALRRGS